MRNGFYQWFRKSAVKSRLKQILPDSVIRKIAYFYNGQWKRAKQNRTPRETLGFETHIVEHCNLKCASCCHFSPLAQEEYLEPSAFERDCKRLAELTKNLRYLRLLGGEPLLHPRITEFFAIARRHFPDAPLEVTTNGILLPKMPDVFWQKCAEHAVEINVTDYPIDIHFDAVKHQRERGVRLTYNFGSMENAKNSFHFSPIDLKGKQNIDYNFNHCQYPNNFCITLRDGRLYTCCIAAHARFFNEYFHENLDIGAANSIGIYEAKTIGEILDFLRKPIPFCRHCKVRRFVYGIEWRPSKKEIAEWTFEK